jgi:hypothetical protein
MSKLFFLVPIALLVSACATNKIPDPTPKKVGFQCLPVPSEWMEAGSIFEVDQAGVSARIGLVDTVTVLKGSAVGFPSYSSNLTYKAGVLLSTLEKLTAKAGWSATVAADFNSTYSVSSSYGDLKLDITEGQPEVNAEAWFKNKGYKVDPAKSYFFVRESISAKDVSYEIKSGDIAKLGGEAKFKELVQGKLDAFQRQADGVYKLTGKFSSPLNVCIKPRQIIAVKGATGQEYLRFQDVEKAIVVTSTK